MDYRMFFDVITEGIEGYLGGWDVLLAALIKAVMVSYITEIMCMIRERKIRKDIWGKEILCVFSVFLLVGIANMLDTQIIGVTNFFRTGTICFYISKTGIRILENIIKLEVPIPKKIKIFLGLLGDCEGNK